MSRGLRRTYIVDPEKAFRVISEEMTLMSFSVEVDRPVVVQAAYRELCRFSTKYRMVNVPESLMRHIVRKALRPLCSSGPYYSPRLKPLVGGRAVHVDPVTYAAIERIARKINKKAPPTPSEVVSFAVKALEGKYSRNPPVGERRARKKYLNLIQGCCSEPPSDRVSD